MRIFIALEIPEKIKKEFSKIQSHLKKTNIKAQWVKEDNFHLTLAFLGNTSVKKIKIIANILKQTAKQIDPIKFSINKIDGFPCLSQPRIIFISLKEESNNLKFLVNKIQSEFKKEKIWFDPKPFIPHLTLGRVKEKGNFNNVIQKLPLLKIEFLANKINLVQSTLTPTGPIYKILKTETLGKIIDNKPKN